MLMIDFILCQDHAEGLGTLCREGSGPEPLRRAACLRRRPSGLGPSAPRQEGGGVLLDPYRPGVAKSFGGVRKAEGRGGSCVLQSLMSFEELRIIVVALTSSWFRPQTESRHENIGTLLMSHNKRIPKREVIWNYWKLATLIKNLGAFIMKCSYFQKLNKNNHTTGCLSEEWCEIRRCRAALCEQRWTDSSGAHVLDFIDIKAIDMHDRFFEYHTVWSKSTASYYEQSFLGKTRFLFN